MSFSHNSYSLHGLIAQVEQYNKIEFVPVMGISLLLHVIIAIYFSSLIGTVGACLCKPALRGTESTIPMLCVNLN